MTVIDDEPCCHHLSVFVVASSPGDLGEKPMWMKVEVNESG